MSIKCGQSGPFPRNRSNVIEKRITAPKSGVSRRYRWKYSKGTFSFPFLKCKISSISRDGHAHCTMNLTFYPDVSTLKLSQKGRSIQKTCQLRWAQQEWSYSGILMQTARKKDQIFQIEEIRKMSIDWMPLTVTNADLFRHGNVKYMRNVCPSTTHCVDSTRIPFMHSNTSVDLDFLYDSNFFPFVKKENASSAWFLSSLN